LCRNADKGPRWQQSRCGELEGRSKKAPDGERRKAPDGEAAVEGERSRKAPDSKNGKAMVKGEWSIKAHEGEKT
jgi:hypothetical protein